jgi:hypothetical protein
LPVDASVEINSDLLDQALGPQHGWVLGEQEDLLFDGDFRGRLRTAKFAATDGQATLQFHEECLGPVFVLTWSSDSFTIADVQPSDADCGLKEPSFLSSAFLSVDQTVQVAAEGDRLRLKGAHQTGQEWFVELVPAGKVLPGLGLVLHESTAWERSTSKNGCTSEGISRPELPISEFVFFSHYEPERFLISLVAGCRSIVHQISWQANSFAIGDEASHPLSSDVLCANEPQGVAAIELIPGSTVLVASNTDGSMTLEQQDWSIVLDSQAD